MIGMTFLLGLAFTLAATALLCAVATRESGLAPATVNPFSEPRFSDVSADTLPDGTFATATLAGDWQSTEVQNLHEVEDVLDWLENHDVRHTELQSRNGRFLVRWR